MPQNRYYYQGHLQQGVDIVLRDDEFHYLSNVMRTREGEIVEVINGNGSLATAEVTKILKKEAHLAVSEVITQEKEARTLRLALAFLKPAHLEYAVEKGCELGVSHFILFPGARSEKKAVSEQYLKRLHTIVLSSTKQCGRLYLPTLEVRDTMKASLEGLVLFGDLESTVHITKQPLENVVTLVIGPESGFTDQERTSLLDLGAKGVLLHKNTLRAETAAVVGAALITSIS